MISFATVCLLLRILNEPQSNGTQALQVRLRSANELQEEAALTPTWSDYLEDNPMKNAHRGWLHIRVVMKG
jgi:hypothetical protein